MCIRDSLYNYDIGQFILWPANDHFFNPARPNKVCCSLFQFGQLLSGPGDLLFQIFGSRRGKFFSLRPHRSDKTGCGQVVDSLAGGHRALSRFLNYFPNCTLPVNVVQGKPFLAGEIYVGSVTAGNLDHRENGIKRGHLLLDLIPFVLAPAPLIIEGSRRQDEWYQIEKKVPTLDAVFTVIKVPGGDTPDINLTSEEWLALYHVDGERTVGEIVEKSGQSAMTTCKAIYDLAAAGFIAPVGAEGEKLASPASEDLEEAITGSREKLTELKKAAADLVGAGRVEEVVVGGPEDELADIVVVEEATPGFQDKPRKRRRSRNSQEEPIAEVPLVLEEEPEKEAAAPIESVPPEEMEESKTEEIEAREEPSLAEQVKEEKPGGGQSVIDYYKSLAIEDVTSAEREIAFKDTGETVDEEVAGEEEPSVGGAGILEEPASG